jgi:cytochrome c2
MSTYVTAILGGAFLGLSLLATFSMYRFWGYPYDKENRRSACPQWKMNIHRAIGYAYLLLYALLMSQMLPRLWTYQVEFPARTVAHIVLGIAIGVLLLIKVSILRWFRHFEEWMPVLGTLVLLCTFVLVGLSVPFVLKERALAAAVGGAFSPANLARVARLLPAADLPAASDPRALATAPELLAGREVLLTKCVHCHDLKTAITRPRTPTDWGSTVRRMAEKPALGVEFTARDVGRVTAYLVAITPELQASAKARRARLLRQAEARQVTGAPAPAGTEQPLAGPAPAGRQADPAPPDAAPATGQVATPGDAAAAKAAFERICASCHELGDVEEAPPRDAAAVRALVARMVDNGLEASAAELHLVEEHLRRTYVEKR